MNQELSTVTNELAISKLNLEIMELRNQLYKVQAEKSSRLEDSILSPNMCDHYRKIAIDLSKSSLIPTIYKGKPEDIFLAMAMGYQLGFPVEQSLQDIAIINGRPCLWGDGLLSLALNHKDCESITEEPILQSDNVIGYTCTVKRTGHEPHTQRFTVKDAQTAGLFKKDGCWTKYPSRMLQMRARSLAIRDKFADALRGLRIAEIEKEDSNIIDQQPEKINFENSSTNTEKLKNILNLNEKNNTTMNILRKDLEEQIKENFNNFNITDSIEDVNIDNEIEKSEEENIFKGCIILDDKEKLIPKNMIAKIEILINQKKLSEERKQKALDFYKVESIDRLTEKQGELFIEQLIKL